MSGYFKPLRRKVGVVTLVMACVFAAGWVRSLSKADLIIAYLGEVWIFNLRSDQCGFGLVAAASGPENTTFGASFHSRPIDRSKSNDALHNSTAPVQLRVPGIRFGYSSRVITHIVFFVSYWLIIIPLTLLSSWLLLSKPRLNKPTPASEA